MTFEAQNAGLSDVFGGQMWFCLKNGIGNSVVYFCNKKTCEKYIRENFQGELKRSMLKELRETHGRAKLYNVFG